MPFTNGTIDLQSAFGVKWDRDDTLTALGYTLSSARSKFPLFYGYWAFKGYADADFMALYEFEVAWNEAFFITWGYATESPNYVDMRSRGSILAPDGAYRVKYGCWVGYGRYAGKGSNCYYVTKGQPNAGATAGTAIVIDHANWMTRYAPERFCLRGCTWGKNDGNAYLQGTIIEGFYFDGGYESKTYDPSFISAGIGMNDFGEASTVRNCYANGFNTYGFQSNKGTPSLFIACSAFSNRKAGFGILSNNGLNTTTIIDPSGDDNPKLIEAIGEPGGVGGGSITVVGGKSETGKRTPLQYQQFFYGVGALNVTITGASVDAQGGDVQNAIEVDFQSYGGLLDVRGIRLNGYKNLVKWTAKGVSSTVASPGSVVPTSFVLTEAGMMFNARGTAPTIPTDPTTPTNPTGPYVDRALWVVSAYNTAPADNFGTHEASKMKDGNANTWWHSGKPQSATGTDYVSVVFSAQTAIKGIVLDLPANDFPNDYPDGLVVQVMVNGFWKAVENPVATYGKKTTVNFKSVVAQRFRFATNKAKGPWLCIAELNAIAG